MKTKIRPLFHNQFQNKIWYSRYKRVTGALRFTDFLYFIFYHFILSYFDRPQVQPTYTKICHYFITDFKQSIIYRNCWSPMLQLLAILSYIILSSSYFGGPQVRPTYTCKCYTSYAFVTNMDTWNPPYTFWL